MTTRGYSLTILAATKVRWEWYSYGQPQLREYLMFNEYELNGDSITLRSNWRQGRTTKAVCRKMRSS